MCRATTQLASPTVIAFTSAEKRNAVPRHATAFLFTLLVGASISGCSPPHQVIEQARQRGAEAGREEGRRAGKVAGFDAGFNSAYKQAYGETLNDLFWRGKFQRIALYSFLVISASFVAGYTLQYMIFYLLRRTGILLDIDRIILPAEATQVDLTNLTSQDFAARQAPAIGILEEATAIKKMPSGGDALILLFLLVFLLPATGCKSQESSAWQKGYDVNYDAGYQEAWQAAEPLGTKDGEKAGLAAAHKGAETGHAWGLYSHFAFWSLVFGVLVGVSLQYVSLLHCRFSESLPQFATVLFVPGMKRSIAYCVFERKRQLLTWVDEQIAQLAATNKLAHARMKAVHDAMVARFQTLSSLESFSQARLLEIARSELERIVSSAEREANPPVAAPWPSNGADNTLAQKCPHCHRTIRYKEKHAGRLVSCPNKECRQQIMLPPVSLREPSSHDPWWQN